jgi:hypothetical protein
MSSGRPSRRIPSAAPSAQLPAESSRPPSATARDRTDRRARAPRPRGRCAALVRRSPVGHAGDHLHVLQFNTQAVAVAPVTPSLGSSSRLLPRLSPARAAGLPATTSRLAVFAHVLCVSAIFEMSFADDDPRLPGDWLHPASQGVFRRLGLSLTGLSDRPRCGARRARQCCAIEDHEQPEGAAPRGPGQP